MNEKEKNELIMQFYREAATYQEFVENCLTIGIDSEEADLLWHELEFKFSH